MSVTGRPDEILYGNQPDITVGECVTYFQKQIDLIDAALDEWKKNPSNDLDTHVRMACSPAANAAVRGAGDKLSRVVHRHRNKIKEALDLLNS